MISTGGEGKISAKKRLRGKIGDPSKKPELKQYNLMDTSEGDLSKLYQSVILHGVYIPESHTDYKGIWRPLACNWPRPDVGMMGRIGKKIRIKYLRIKGYVAASPFLVTQVRYRLVLYRTRTNLVNGVERYDQAWLKTLYKAYNNMETDIPEATIRAVQLCCTENYYMSVFDKDELKSKDCKRRVLLSGLLKPNADIGNYQILTGGIRLATGYLSTDNTDTIVGNVYGSTFQVGQQSATGYFNAPTSGSIPLPTPSDNVELHLQHSAISSTTNSEVVHMSGQFQKHVAEAALYDDVNSRAFFPIDITVNMNDNVDCYEYRYVLVLESDWAVGQTPSGLFQPNVNASNFKMKICPQIYYFDD